MTTPDTLVRFVLCEDDRWRIVERTAMYEHLGK
jgi:hypothetical protein